MSIVSSMGRRSILLALCIVAGSSASSNQDSDSISSIEEMNDKSGTVALVFVNGVSYPERDIRPCVTRHWGTVFKTFKGTVKEGDKIYLGHTGVYRHHGSSYYIVFLRSEPKKIMEGDSFILEGKYITPECAGKLDYLQVSESGQGAVRVDYVSDELSDGTTAYTLIVLIKDTVSYPGSLSLVSIPPRFKASFESGVNFVSLESFADYLGRLNSLPDRSIEVDVHKYWNIID